MKTYENHWTPFKAIDVCRPLRCLLFAFKAVCNLSFISRRASMLFMSTSGGVRWSLVGSMDWCRGILNTGFSIDGNHRFFWSGNDWKSGFKIGQNHPILWGVGRGNIPRIHRRKWAFSWILLVISQNSKGVETVIWSWKIFRKDSSVGDQKISKEKEHTTGGDGDIIVFPPWSSKIWALTNLNEAFFFYNRPFFRFSINGRFTATYM